MCPREVCIEHGYSLYLCTRARLAEALSILRRIAYKGWDGILLIDPSDNCRPPRPGDTTVSLTWLKGVLGAAGLTDFGMEVKGLQENRGLVGSITCIRLTFSGTPPKVAGYNGLVLKMSTHGVQGRKRTIALSGEREARFYSSDFYRNLPHNFAPAVLYSYASSLFGESVLLMEDVTLREGARVLGVNMILGNQIWGVPQPTGEDPLQMLEAMFLRAAELHARFWHDNNLIDGNPWFKGALWYRNRGRLEWEAAIAFNHKAWQAAKELERGNPDIHFSEKLVRIIGESKFSMRSYRSIFCNKVSSIKAFVIGLRSSYSAFLSSFKFSLSVGIQMHHTLPPPGRNYRNICMTRQYHLPFATATSTGPICFL